MDIIKIMTSLEAKYSGEQAYRMRLNNVIGSYKGGIRFHHSVNLSILKFLKFKQLVKNALTLLPMGDGKSEADFPSKGKSEIMRFCQAYMLELWRPLDLDKNVPAKYYSGS